MGLIIIFLFYYIFNIKHFLYWACMFLPSYLKNFKTWEYTTVSKHQMCSDQWSRVRGNSLTSTPHVINSGQVCSTSLKEKYGFEPGVLASQCSASSAWSWLVLRSKALGGPIWGGLIYWEEVLNRCDILEENEPDGSQSWAQHLDCLSDGLWKGRVQECLPMHPLLSQAGDCKAGSRKERSETWDQSQRCFQK